MTPFLGCDCLRTFSIYYIMSMCRKSRTKHGAVEAYYVVIIMIALGAGFWICEYNKCRNLSLREL